MKKVIFTLLSIFCFYAITGRAQVFNKDTLMYHGDINKYINFVFLGDGYTANQQGLYHNHVDTIIGSFFGQSPYVNYINYFNVVAIDVVSPQSGVKHPRTASDCPPPAEFPFANPSTYFDVSFDMSGIHRLPYPSTNNGYAAVGTVLANNFPNYDQIMIVSNTDQYGGAGGEFAVGTANQSSVEIMLHEVGHSFAGLADEYWAGDQYAAEKPNMTNVAYATPSLVKWKNWLDVGGIGIYAYGANGNPANWFRPHQNCKMQFLNVPFCSVCKQTIVETIQSLVNTIVAYTPATGSTVNVSQPLTFKLNKLMLPIPNTLKIQWEYDGNTIAQQTDSLVLNNTQLANGSHTLRAVVTDTTFWVREDQAYTLNVNQVVWSLNVTGGTTGIHDQLSKTIYKIFPNPAKDFISIQASGLTGSGKATISLMDNLGRTLYSGQTDFYNGSFDYRIPTAQMASGSYYLIIKTPIGTDRAKVIISR